jgi:hypothetical protein
MSFYEGEMAILLITFIPFSKIKLRFSCAGGAEAVSYEKIFLGWVYLSVFR